MQKEEYPLVNLATAEKAYDWPPLICMYNVRATASLFAISTCLVFQYLAVDGFDFYPLEFVFCSFTGPVMLSLNALAVALMLRSNAIAHILSDRLKVREVFSDLVEANETSQSFLITQRAGPDPADFGWIKRWAAIGDSFTAGIGSGRLYSQQKEDYRCSRYDHSYPSLANNAFGPAVQDFQYIACSGDRSVQIHDQISKMQGNVDMVMMTAGGKDLCLVRLDQILTLQPHHR